jgi:hypothetical protein
MQSHVHNILRFYADQYDGQCDSKLLCDNDECLTLCLFRRRMEAMALPGTEI